MKDMIEWSDDRIELIKKTYCKGGSDLDLQLFIATCERLKLSPEARQIYAVIRQSKGVPTMTIQVSIDGFRLVADRTGQYEGQTPVQWCGMDGIWREIWTGKGNPVAARVGVYKRHFREPLYAVAHWDEYFQSNYDGKPTQFWARMPRLMLGKVAEALALRKAFPNELSGVYAPEEIPPELDEKLKHPPIKVQAIEPTPKPEPISLSVKERIPKMLAAFHANFSLDENQLVDLMGKTLEMFEEKDIQTMEKLFKDLKNGHLDISDLDVIKELMKEEIEI
jgi:phage recombination protein Bet